MNLRRWILRADGLAVALIVSAVASQLLFLGFEATPLIERGLVRDLTSWMQRRPRVDVSLMGGTALLACSVGLWWSLVRSFGIDLRVITVRGDNGWTKLDRPSLEDAIERHLERADRRIDVKARIGRSGTTRLAVTTPDRSPTDTVAEIRTSFDRFCRERAIPCRLDRVTTSATRRNAGRRRVR